MMRRLLFTWIAILLVAGRLPADDTGWRVVLKTGNVLKGQLLRQDSVEVELKTEERGVVVIPKSEIEVLERLQGTVTAAVPTTGPAPEGAVPEKFSIAQADAIRLELGSRVKGLEADVALPFETAEFGRGRWKWPGPYRAFVYREECPTSDHQREVGELVYHLERVPGEETLRWVPLRWDPLKRQWHLRGFVPPTLAVHRRLEALRAELDEKTVHLSRVAEVANLPKQDARRPPQKVIDAMRRELLARHDQAAEQYVKAAWVARRFLPQEALSSPPRVLEAGKQSGVTGRSKTPATVRTPKDREGKGATSSNRRD
ncbi:MAG: hypothetical protein H6833_04700 [Planctomycetes bacterium]|nr:hypothetical protein [Planctomycetota bacterium]